MMDRQSPLLNPVHLLLGRARNEADQLASATNAGGGLGSRLGTHSQAHPSNKCRRAGGSLGMNTQPPASILGLLQCLLLRLISSYYTHGSTLHYLDILPSEDVGTNVSKEDLNVGEGGLCVCVCWCVCVCVCVCWCMCVCVCVCWCVCVRGVCMCVCVVVGICAARKRS